MNAAPSCPECSALLWCDPRLGLMCAHAESCELGRAEDQQAYDDRSACGLRTTLSPDYPRDDRRQYGALYVRDSTAVERTLMIACGADADAVARAMTSVHFIAGGIRRRVFTSVRLTGLPGLPTTDPNLVR